MWLLDEKSDDIVVKHDVQFGDNEKVSGIIEQLLSNPIFLSAKVFKKEYEIGKDFESPIIRRSIILTTSLIPDATEACGILRDEFTFDSPFTLSFLWNKSTFGWGKPKLDRLQSEFLSAKSRNIDSDNLTLLFRNVLKMTGFKDLTSLFQAYPSLEYFLQYPDIANFRNVFPFAVFSPYTDGDSLKEFSIRDYESNISKYCCDETDREVMDNIVETARLNTEVVKKLELTPNYKSKR